MYYEKSVKRHFFILVFFVTIKEDFPWEVRLLEKSIFEFALFMGMINQDLKS